MEALSTTKPAYITLTRFVMPGHDAQIVGDQDHGRAAFRGEALEQVEHLRLDGHVQGRRGLVRDQQLGLEREGHGDHHALAHAAAELVWEVAQPGFGLRDTHGIEQFQRPGTRLRPGDLDDAPGSSRPSAPRW